MGTHRFLAHPGPVGFAHRGATGPDAGENADRAFERAVALGFRHLETDVHLTRDGVLVLHHDAELDRTTDASGPIAEARWEDLRTATVDGGGGVPRLDEALASWPHVRWNIDCKAPAAAEPLARAVAGDLHRVCLASFTASTLRRLRRLLGSQACTSAGPNEVRALAAAARLPAGARPMAGRGLAPVTAADVLQVPVEHDGTVIVDERFVELAHAAGKDVHVWTVDDADEMARLLDLGVDGVMTDAPEVLVDVLHGRGAWPPTDAVAPADGDVRRAG